MNIELTAGPQRHAGWTANGRAPIDALVTALCHLYRDEHGGMPRSVTEAADWAFEQGLLEVHERMALNMAHI